jgi:hypothetical protein
LRAPEAQLFSFQKAHGVYTLPIRPVKGNRREVAAAHPGEGAHHLARGIVPSGATHTHYL